MKSRNGIMQVILAIFLISSISLTGCTKESKPTESAGTATETTKATTEATAKVEPAKELSFVKLKMYYPSGGAGGKDDPLIQKAVNDYLKEKINANLELNAVPWGSWGQKMPLIFQSGEQADLAWTGGGNYYLEVAKKAYQPLDDLIEQYGQELKATIEPEFLEGPRVAGKLYAIPTNKEKVQQNAAFLRKDIVEKYKIDVSKIKTIGDFTAIFEATKGEQGIKTAFRPHEYNGNVPSGFDNPDLEWISDYGYFNMKTGEVVGTYSLPQIEKKYEIIRDWFVKGYSNSDAATNQTDSWSAVKNGKSWIAFGSAKPGSELEISQNVGHEMVKVSLGKPYIGSSTLTGSMLAIPTSSIDPARAMMVLNMLHTDPYLLNLIVYGVEGKQFVKVSDNIIKLPDGIQSSADTGYAPGINWEIGNQYIQYLYDNQDPDQWVKYKEWGTQGEDNKTFLLGFNFDPEPVKNEISALDNTKKIYDMLLSTGSVDTKSTLTKFNKELDNKHIDVLLKEYKKQIDAWMKLNNKELLK